MVVFIEPGGFGRVANTKISACFTCTRSLVIDGQIFTHEYHQISVNSVSRFSLKKKKFVETSDGFKKTVQNQKHPGRLMKKSVRWYSFENFCSSRT